MRLGGETGPGRADGLGRCAPTFRETLLLRAALAPSDEEAVAAWRDWSRRFTLESVPWRMHAVLPMVAGRIGAETMGEWGALAQTLRRQAWVDAQLDLVAARDLAEIVGAIGVEPLIVKGAALALSVYEPGLRSMGDVDVVVGAGSFTASIDALRDAGWTATERLSDVAYSRAVPLRSPSGRTVDVHRWVLYPRYVRRSEDAVWRSAVSVGVHGREVQVPGLAHALVIAILHGLDPREASAIRWPLDVGSIVRAAGDESGWWDEVVSVALDLGAGRLVGRGLEWYGGQFGVDVGRERIAALLMQPPDRWLAAEWALKGRGLPVFARVRHYVDGVRALGEAPSMSGYLRVRQGLLREVGGLPGYLRRRRRRFADTVRTVRR